MDILVYIFTPKVIGQQKRNESDTCLMKTHMYKPPCTLHFHLVLSHHRSILLLTVDCRLKGVEIEEFIPITLTGKLVGIHVHYTFTVFTWNERLAHATFKYYIFYNAVLWTVAWGYGLTPVYTERERESLPHNLNIRDSRFWMNNIGGK